jgi:hypothetical protein
LLAGVGVTHDTGGLLEGGTSLRNTGCWQGLQAEGHKTILCNKRTNESECTRVRKSKWGRSADPVQLGAEEPKGIPG